MKNFQKTFVAITTSIAVTFSIYGTTNYWDNNDSVAGFGTAGGTWGIDGNWSADELGTSETTVTNTTANDVLYFGTLNDGLATGTITVNGTNQAFNTMIFGKASGAITINEGALELANPFSTIAIHNGTNTIGSALTGTNGIHKAGAAWHGSFIPGNQVKIFPSLKLAHFAGVDGILGGTSINFNQPKAADVFHFVHNTTNATFQLQIYENGNTKCVALELTQIGPDIYARVRYAKYISGNQLGYDFDTGGGTGMSIATSYASGNYGYGCAELFLLPETGVYEGFLTESAAVAFSKATLRNVASASANFGGGNIFDVNAPGTLCFFENDGTTANCQFQIYDNNFTKCVKVELMQIGENITARAVYAKYYSSKFSNVIGFNFDTGGTSTSIATSFAESGYGLAQLQLDYNTDKSVLSLTGRNTFSGNMILGMGCVEMNEQAVLGDGYYSGDIMNSGDLIFNGSERQTLAGSISGGGSLIKGFASQGTHLARNSQPGYVQTISTVIITNATLSHFQNATAYMGGKSMITGTADGFFFDNNGTYATVQFQIINGRYTKCVKVELEQSGADIAAKAVYAKYIEAHDLGFNFDLGGKGAVIATSDNVINYGVKSLTLHSCETSRLILDGSGTNSYAGGTEITSGGIVEINGSSRSLPEAEGIIINKNGELILNVKGFTSKFNTVGGNNPIEVNGGLLTLAQQFNTGTDRPVTINGGTLNSITAVNGDNCNYLNNLTLMNGAAVTGYPIRMGFVATPTINVVGTNACSIPAGISLLKLEGYTPLTFNIADVTDSQAPDLTIAGVIRDFPNLNLAWMPIVKTGAGMLSISGENTHLGVYTIEQGTLALDGNGSMNIDNDIILDGGTLAMGACTNNCGTLTVGNAGGTLVLSSGLLSFTDSSAVSWSGTLNLTNTLIEKTVRFGTDNTALSAAQLDSIVSICDRKLRLTKDGYLSATPCGTYLLIR
jgi:autotransporter-associated beta strand protein